MLTLVGGSKCLKKPRQLTCCYTLTQLAPARETSTAHADRLCEWLDLPVEGEEGGKDASRAVL